MGKRVRNLWPDLSHNLAFIPGLVVAVFFGLGVALVRVDEHLDLSGVPLTFQGDGSAARTVLSVIAGSLITVAGLTFTITMVVLQLASSQFSPRLLRKFFGDRVTQVTIGVYVGTFVYSILVLRAVGSSQADFVPHLSVTIASLLSIGAVLLLVVFLHHVSLMVQVSHVTSGLARDTLSRLDALYPASQADEIRHRTQADRLEERPADAPGCVRAVRPGYVQRVGLDDLAESAGGQASRVAILVCPGDFVSGEAPIAEVWPAAAGERCREAVLGAVSITSERDLDQDIDFGLRQLTDIALKAMSPGINDPMTAVTCIGYLRAILVRLTDRAEPPRVLRYAERDLIVHARRRRYDEFLDPLLQISRYVDGDAWVAGEILTTLRSCADIAARAGAQERLRVIRDVAVTVAEQASAEAGNPRDAASIDRALAGVEAQATRGNSQRHPDGGLG